MNKKYRILIKSYRSNADGTPDWPSVYFVDRTEYNRHEWGVELTVNTSKVYIPWHNIERIIEE